MKTVCLIRILSLFVLFIFFSCDGGGKIKIAHTPLGKGYWFPTNSGSILIYGRPVGYKIYLKRVIIISRNQIPLLCNLITKKQSLKLTEISKLLYADSKGKVIENAVIVDLGEDELDGDESSVDVGFYFQNKSISLAIYSLQQTSDGNVKISLFSKEELKHIKTKIVSRLASKQYKINLTNWLFSPFWSKFSSLFIAKIPAINQEEVYANYRFIINKTYHEKRNGLIFLFQKNLGLVATYCQKEGMELMLEDADYYKEFFVEFKTNPRFKLIDRLIYYYIPGKDKYFEFIDKHFFTKSPSGELMTKKIKL